MGKYFVYSLKVNEVDQPTTETIRPIALGVFFFKKAELNNIILILIIEQVNLLQSVVI